MNTVKHLGKFLQDEMRQRDMSNFAFAEFIGVSHTTINRFVDFGVEDVGYPSLDFLIKLARATEKDMRYIITLVAPDDVLWSTDPTPEDVQLSQKIAHLDESYRKIVEYVVSVGLNKG
jgi:transcriptional regulator with XRE-family HTH domain